nr:D-alanyl-D-alanine carboxypeptidase/D-alanyl-D-alanine-endopeptidase [Shewanella intestini]
MVGISFSCIANNSPVNEQGPSISLTQLQQQLTAITSNVSQDRASQLSSLIYRMDTQQILFEHNSAHYFQPASVQKIFTAVAAQHVLGLKHHFDTQIRLSAPFGSLTPVSNTKLIHSSAEQVANNKQTTNRVLNEADGVYNGDVLIRFGGDPLLTHQQLIHLISALSKLGIKQINGEIVIASNVTPTPQPRGWVWDDLGICYGAPITNGIVIDQNCLKANLAAKRYNETSKITLSPYPIDVQKAYRINGHSSPLLEFNTTAYFKKNQQAKTNNNKDDCRLNLAPVVNGRYNISGCYTNRLSLPLSLAINNPSQFAYAFVEQTLAKLHISHAPININQPIKFDNQSLKAHFPLLIAQHQSDSTQALVTQMLQQSNNVIAETLLNAIAQQLAQQLHQTQTVTKSDSDNAGNAGNNNDNPAWVLTQVLSQLGLDVNDANVTDGSGLSRYNLVNAHQLLAVLRYQASAKVNLLSQLPTAGESGTLRTKAVYLQDGIKHRLHGKSGSMLGVHNLIGVLNSKANGTLLFVILENNISPKRQDKQSYVNAILNELATLPPLN